MSSLGKRKKTADRRGSERIARGFAASERRAKEIRKNFKIPLNFISKDSDISYVNNSNLIEGTKRIYITRR